MVHRSAGWSRGRRKKLRAAGRHWATAGRPAQLEEDAAAWGLDLDPRQQAAQHCDVWPQHEQALEVFLACTRQWRIVAGMAGAFYQGIDATALHSTMQMMRVENQRETLALVHEIEAGALEEINSK